MTKSVVRGITFWKEERTPGILFLVSSTTHRHLFKTKIVLFSAFASTANFIRPTQTFSDTSRGCNAFVRVTTFAAAKFARLCRTRSQLRTAVCASHRRRMVSLRRFARVGERSRVSRVQTGPSTRPFSDLASSSLPLISSLFLLLLLLHLCVSFASPSPLLLFLPLFLLLLLLLLPFSPLSSRVHVAGIFGPRSLLPRGSQRKTATRARATFHTGVLSAYCENRLVWSRGQCHPPSREFPPFILPRRSSPLAKAPLVYITIKRRFEPIPTLRRARHRTPT